MKTIDTQELATVAGGVKNDQVTTALATIQTSIKDLASQNNNNSSNNLLLPMVMMMALNRPQPTVVAAGAPAVAAGPVINISNRFRSRWW